ncbi:olfactory receptor 2B6-like [Leptodactylus fuscus]|uniref:olfactory receptor 2B6-like n=1 Tax=Leptodactylus fuscus TaxID=238119 RepID=UPI003F4EE6F5
MYLFFCNLSTIDSFYTTVIVPKLLYILSSGNDLVSFTQCFAQIYFFFLSACVEPLLLFVMGFDRYVAICQPLTYHQILNKNVCILIVVAIWISAFLNSFLFLHSLLKLPFNEVVSIQNFFCDAKDILRASSGSSQEFYVLIYVEIVLLGILPLFCNLLSYVRIIRVILHIKSKEGRRKTFSTCLSHLIVMIIYYSAGGLAYMMPFSDHTVIANQIISVFYTMVVPMINPLIYSLRNYEIISAFNRLLKIK